MGSPQKRVRNGKVTWRACWRDPDGHQRNRSFDRKVDAQAFLTTVEQSKLVGTYLDPSRGQVTVGDAAEQWLAGKLNLAPTTRARYESALSVHVLPRWGRVPLARVTHGDIQAWLVSLSSGGQSGASVRKAHGVLSQVLALSVRDRRLSANPAEGAQLPRLVERGRRYLTAAQVEALAEAAGRPPAERSHPGNGSPYEQYRLVVLVLAYCGLRWGEMAALRVERVDLLRRRLHVAESVTEVNGGRVVWGPPKTHETRSVPVPRFLATELETHLSTRHPGDLVFTSPEGGVLRNRNARRAWFDRAAASIGEPGLTPHELRHTAASLAVSAGAHVKAVQRMLGHASAVMTLDRYADLFDDDLDAVADRLDEVRDARVAQALPEEPLRAAHSRV